MSKKSKIKDIKVVTIDGDGCLFAYENVGSVFHSSWDALGHAYGLKEIWDERTRKYYKRSESDLIIDKLWAEEDTADLKGKDVAIALNALYPVPYCKGAKEFADASKGKLFRGILSTGIDIIVNKAYEELGLDFAYCNVLHRENGTFDGTISYLVPTWTKFERIIDICRELEVSPREICHIGDNKNDLPVAERVGMFIALRAKRDDVKKAANFVVDDFFGVMKIFGLDGKGATRK